MDKKKSFWCRIGLHKWKEVFTGSLMFPVGDKCERCKLVRQFNGYDFVYGYDINDLPPDVEPPAEKSNNGMETITIYRFQAKAIKNALRLAARTLESKDKETSMDRDIMQASAYIDNALKGNIDKHVPRL